jgi:hypothetical protein
MTKDSNSKMRICDSMSDRKMKKRIRTHGAHIFVMKQLLSQHASTHTRAPQRDDDDDDEEEVKKIILIKNEQR